MGKASSSKKVARAARAGGNVRTSRDRKWGFPAAIAGIVVAGTLLVVLRPGRRGEPGGRAAQARPRTTGTPPTASTSATPSVPPLDRHPRRRVRHPHPRGRPDPHPPVHRPGGGSQRPARSVRRGGQPPVRRRLLHAAHRRDLHHRRRLQRRRGGGAGPQVAERRVRGRARDHHRPTSPTSASRATARPTRSSSARSRRSTTRRPCCRRRWPASTRRATWRPARKVPTSSIPEDLLVPPTTAVGHGHHRDRRALGHGHHGGARTPRPHRRPRPPPRRDEGGRPRRRLRHAPPATDPRHPQADAARSSIGP